MAAAGEMAVKEGRLVGLTDKSGHYQPGPEAIVRSLLYFQARGVDLRGVKFTSGLMARRIARATQDPVRRANVWGFCDELLRRQGAREHCHRDAIPPDLSRSRSR